MGAYVYTARSPKLARHILIEWTNPNGLAQWEQEWGDALCMSYLYKPSWSMREDDAKRWGPVIERQERAWDHLRVPRYAVIGDKGIRKGDSVIDWGEDKRARLSCYDDPDWGHCVRTGRVRIVSPTLPDLRLTCESCGAFVHYHGNTVCLHYKRATREVCERGSCY